MSRISDDEIIDQFVAVTKRDAHAKHQFAEALRYGNKAAFRNAVQWVVDNIIKPVGRAASARLVAAILYAFGLG